MCGGGRRKGRCGWQCVGRTRHSLRLVGVGSELVEGVQRPVRKVSLGDWTIKVWAGGTDSGMLAVAGGHHEGCEVRPIVGAQSGVDEQKRGVGGWPRARKGGVGTPGPPLPSGSDLVVLPGLRARERCTRGGVVVETLAGNAAPSGPRMDLMGGRGKWGGSIWETVGREREGRDDGKSDVSRFQGGGWAGLAECAAGPRHCSCGQCTGQQRQCVHGGRHAIPLARREGRARGILEGRGASEIHGVCEWPTGDGQYQLLAV